MSFVHGSEASAYVSPLYYSKGGYHSSHHGHYISSVVQAPTEYHSHVAAPVEYAPLYTSRYHHKGGYQSSHHTVVDSGLYGSTYLSRKHLKRALKHGSYFDAAPVVVAPLEHHAYVSAAVEHAPLYASQYHLKGGYQSFLSPHFRPR